MKQLKKHTRENQTELTALLAAYRPCRFLLESAVRDYERSLPPLPHGEHFEFKALQPGGYAKKPVTSPVEEVQ